MKSKGKSDDDREEELLKLLMSDKFPPETSDRSIALYFKCCKYFVRKARERGTNRGWLHGTAAAGDHRYKKGAILRGGYKHDGKGGNKAVKPAGPPKLTVKLLKRDRKVRIGTSGPVEMTPEEWRDWLRGQLSAAEDWMD